MPGLCKPRPHFSLLGLSGGMWGRSDFTHLPSGLGSPWKQEVNGRKAGACCLRGQGWTLHSQAGGPGLPACNKDTERLGVCQKSHSVRAGWEAHLGGGVCFRALCP